MALPHSQTKHLRKTLVHGHVHVCIPTAGYVPGLLLAIAMHMAAASGAP